MNNRKEKLWSRGYIIALIVMFGLFIVISISLSLLTIYAKNLTGVDTYAGIMTSIFTVGALAMRFVSGSLTERLGNKRVILIGIILMIGATGMFLLADTIGVVFIGRTLQGVGFGLSTTATSTYISVICHPSRLLEGIGFTAIAQSLSAVIGPVVGFWLVGPDYRGFTLLFLVMMGIGLLTLLLMLFGKGHGNEEKIVHQSHGCKDAFSWAYLRLPIIILFLNALSQSAIVSFLALYAISLGFTSIGSFFTINAIGMIASRFVVNPLVKKFGKFQIIFMSTFVYFISLIFLTQVRTMGQMLFLAFPAGFAIGSIGPVINTLLIEVMPNHKKGLANAVYFSTLDIGYGLGSFIWGVIASLSGYMAVFYMAACLQILGIGFGMMQIVKVDKGKNEAQCFPKC
ncbi:MFS transporter [Vallitalea pronyensis]|uniref:MFS transporter n=1 Tax=Vallitalea pronyensis TaxID=1348613 RepID=A0A8J8SHM8_9FIRM|nr:MFS transporter [Vallitalea pronyensis]QUI23741.1 MFS transporter [Vallitalea pronyensis]